jgi:hypothetical protein
MVQGDLIVVFGIAVMGKLAHGKHFASWNTDHRLAPAVFPDTACRVEGVFHTRRLSIPKSDLPVDKSVLDFVTPFCRGHRVC